MVCFSIIIPTYNSENTIQGCLRNVISQTFDNYEVVVVDSKSTDNTLNLILEFQDERIKVFSERDKGIYDAMNKGIAYAKGDWLFFLGSDDEFYDSNVLEDVFRCISIDRDVCVYGNVYLTGDTGWGYKGQFYDGEFKIEKLLKKNISHQAIFYSKKVFAECGLYNTSYAICADYDLNLKVASLFKLKYINRTITRFNAGGESTGKEDTAFIKDFNRNVILYFRKELHKKHFRKFEHHLLHQSITDFKNVKILNSIYHLTIGIYFKLLRKLNLKSK